MRAPSPTSYLTLLTLSLGLSCGGGDDPVAASDAGGMDAAVGGGDAGPAHDASSHDDPGDGSVPRSDAAPGDGGRHHDAGDGCRSDSECGNTEFCWGPDERVCGVAPREECSSDEACGDGVCHAFADGCSPDGVGSACGQPCSVSGCDEGFTCSDSGHCVPTVCGSAGFTCSTAERCDPASIDTLGPPHAVTHGCVAIACDQDAACPEQTVCVNGHCQTGLGRCSLPPP